MEANIYNIIPHEFGHIEIRKLFDSICQDNNIIHFNDRGMQIDPIAISIEEFIIDATKLKFLTGTLRGDV